MNISDEGYTVQYMVKYTDLQDGVQALLRQFDNLKLPVPPKEAFTVRPKFKRIDILYNPVTKQYKGLHSISKEDAYR